MPSCNRIVVPLAAPATIDRRLEVCAVVTWIVAPAGGARGGHDG